MPYVLASSAYVDNSSTTGSPLTIQQLTVACSGRGNTDGIIIMNWQADVQQADVRTAAAPGSSTPARRRWRDHWQYQREQPILG